MAVVEYIPLFPIALVTSFLVQYLFQKMKRDYLVNRRIMDRLTGAALEILIVAAIATIHVGALIDNGIPLLLLTAVGILFNLVVFFILGLSCTIEIRGFLELAILPIPPARRRPAC